MTKWGRFRPAALAALLVLSVASCDTGTRATPMEVVPPPAAAVVSADNGSQYTLIEGRPPLSLADLSLSQVIGLSGGSLTLAGHTLTVPAGAVTQLTVFTMVLLPTGVVEVSLTALQPTLLTGLLNIGAKGFRKPVDVTLTYAWATNVKDPSRLVILRRPNSGVGVHEVVPSKVDAKTKTVTARLDHFSRYCMASN